MPGFLFECLKNEKRSKNFPLKFHPGTGPKINQKHTTLETILIMDIHMLHSKLYIKWFVKDRFKMYFC